MNYCPHCSTPLRKKVDVCPECKKVVDYKMLGDVFAEGDNSQINRKARRKIWFKEHALVIVPFITLVIGFLAGAVLMFGYLQIAFQNEREDYDSQISELNNTITQNKSTAQSSSQEFQNIIDQKDQIIGIVSEQLDLMGRAVNFTNRLDRNCTITPKSTLEADFYRRNILYLNSQFDQQVEALAATEYEPRRTYSLITFPSMIE